MYYSKDIEFFFTNRMHIVFQQSNFLCRRHV